MALAGTKNILVLQYFGLDADDDLSIAPCETGPEPYMRSGSHPDIVERLWNQIGVSLPEDCRCRVGHCPALAHPKTKIIFGLAMGTQYAIRLPPPLIPEALKAGAKTSTVWGLKNNFDLGSILGADWIFGAWLPVEVDWCRFAYESAGAA